jgi:hypothetical protein
MTTFTTVPGSEVSADRWENEEAQCVRPKCSRATTFNPS